MVLAPKLQLTMPGAGSSNFCGCKPLLTTKNSEAKGTPPLVLTTKKQRGQRLQNHMKPIIKPIGKTHKTVKT